MTNDRTQTRQLHYGTLPIGGGAPVVVQSMTNTDTRDAVATVAQIRALAVAGCELVRVAVPDEAAAAVLGEIKRQCPLPLVADIHFHHRLALMAVAQGVDGLRLNPGNIGGEVRVREVVAACRDRGVPIRIGVNAGSLERDLEERYGPTPAALVESALRHVAMLERFGFELIKISLKSSNVPDTVAACRLLATRVDYPQHIGITEAGTPLRGAIKSAVGLGILLHDGIGDTLRVSLTGDPVDEIFAAYQILGSLGRRRRGIELVSCPTCGRTEIDLIGLAAAAERRLAHIDLPLTVAVMGCVVNGPGEARHADVGIAGGRGSGLLFRRGEVVRRLPANELLDALVAETEALARERAASALTVATVPTPEDDCP
ncbi:MAG: flavodoxin-dependent (E)-4-hydroxy-3-methylbut-2-enyl-diphosphate synthase [Deltaproteobacteria bacterium]|nr:flavodoxin-dependent (E)-4-hydroxy-3-methylbut-2-enyl-diphosphate synthase [Candidatus Anaeroferrophillacea bacterium]